MTVDATRLPQGTSKLEVEVSFHPKDLGPFSSTVVVPVEVPSVDDKKSEDKKSDDKKSDTDPKDEVDKRGSDDVVMLKLFRKYSTVSVV